ncbi:hypothetical protein RFM41_13185 [Mesorhizobium sp. VK25A]|uniref:Lipoprotein n=1 Tax=Mesorhizobium vachelliae TaxID=3072309 RepID=A0ABU5A9C4_9HYPH|nr:MULTISPECIES: hypothetical protein [unclassified Mesorhizobium]MDX8532796.1 hypothetical protein [Mesorhizobium sp. VK25D]MDX8544698.1 hypothetical protein [Mesorhizobium sp. VK25A]
MYRRTLFCLAAVIAVSGCAADYLNNYDTMTLASGDANNTNRLLQTVDPFNPNSNNTHIEGDGQRSAGVAQRYLGIPLAPLGQASDANGGGGGDTGNHPCDLQTQVDSLGRPCGGRAAEVKPGGRTGHEVD